MNSRSRFIAAFALMILAMSLAARIYIKDESKPTQPAPGVAEHRQNTGPHASRGYSATQDPQAHARATGQRTPRSSDHLTVRSDPKADDAGSMGNNSPDARALRVEAHARARLAELDERLQLGSDQKRRIFPLLARSSPDYDPNMLIGGIPGHQIAQVQNPTAGGNENGYADSSPDSSAAIMSELDAGQQAIYEDLLIDDLLWWSDIIAQIEEDFMNANPGATQPVPVVIDDMDAGENLFDLLGR